MPRVLQRQLLIENLPLSNSYLRRVGSTRNILSVINGVLSATVRFLLAICSVSMAALLFYGAKLCFDAVKKNNFSLKFYPDPDATGTYDDC